MSLQENYKRDYASFGRSFDEYVASVTRRKVLKMVMLILFVIVAILLVAKL